MDCKMSETFQTEDRRPPIVELVNVTKTYRSRKTFFSKETGQVTAMDDISLSIHPGEIFGLVGQSGSGKTTTGRLLVKLEEPTSGTIKLNNVSIHNLCGKALRQYRSKVQMIFQDPYQSLNPHLSISETIMEPLQVNCIGDTESRRDKVFTTLETVGLVPGKEYYHRYPHQLSGGQRQRVAIARAIVLEPGFIVADEPTSMLDATIAIQILRLLKKIRDQYRMAFLFITHNLAAAKFLCDRMAVIHNGKIVEFGTTKEIIETPTHPYTQKLIQTHPGFKF